MISPSCNGKSSGLLGLNAFTRFRPRRQRRIGLVGAGLRQLRGTTPTRRTSGHGHRILAQQGPGSHHPLRGSLLRCRCDIGSWGVPGGAVSENGCLCQREEGHGGGSRRRSVLTFPALSSPVSRPSRSHRHVPVPSRLRVLAIGLGALLPSGTSRRDFAPRDTQGRGALKETLEWHPLLAERG